jgi:hypothetical protein
MYGKGKSGVHARQDHHIQVNNLTPNDFERIADQPIGGNSALSIRSLWDRNARFE